MIDLDSLSLDEIRALRTTIADYRKMTKELGNRGKELFYRNLTGNKRYVVEFFPTLGEDTAWEQSQIVFSRSFSETPTRDEVHFYENAAMKGGMKVYVDDEMVDMSYQKVENTLQR